MITTAVPAQRRVTPGAQDQAAFGRQFKPHSGLHRPPRVFLTAFPTVALSLPSRGLGSSGLSPVPAAARFGSPLHPEGLSRAGTWQARCQERWKEKKERRERGQRERGGVCLVVSASAPGSAMLSVKDATPPPQARRASHRASTQSLFHEDLAHGAPSSRRSGAPRSESSSPAPGRTGRGRAPARESPGMGPRPSPAGLLSGFGGQPRSQRPVSA